MASAQTTESSQKSSESQVTDTLKDTIALDVQGPPYIARVLAELSATGEVTEGAVFRSSGWVGGLKIIRVYNCTVSHQDYFCCCLLPLAF